MKEQWRKEMQHKLADYREAAPEISWSDVEMAVAEHKRSSAHGAKVIPMWSRRIAAAAAVVLFVAGIGYLSFNKGNISDTNDIAKTAGTSSVKSNVTPNVTAKQTAMAEQESTVGNDIIDKIAAAIIPSKHVDGATTMLAAATDEAKPAPATVETSPAVTQETEKKSGTARKEVARQHYYSDGNDKYRATYKSERSSHGGLSAGLVVSNAMSGYNSTGSGGIALSSANAIGDYEGAFSPDNVELMRNPNSDFTTKTHHRQPVRVGVRVKYNINERWGVESGVTYSYLSSEIDQNNNAYAYKIDQKLHYVGVPVNVNYNFLTTKHLNVYASAGGMAEKMVKGKATTKYTIDNQLQSTTSEDVKIKPLQYSVNGAVGVEYQFGSGLGIYAEPGVSYYFDNSSHVQTIYNDKPFNINLNVGLRLNIK